MRNITCDGVVKCLTTSVHACRQRRAEVVDKLTGFWPTVLVSHERLSELISEEDEEALQSLSRIEVHEFDDIKSGYKIDFVSSFRSSDHCFTDLHLVGFVKSRGCRIVGRRLVNILRG